MFEEIPAEIKAIPRWVCAWAGSKVPMQARQRKAASSTNPETWDTYEAAERAVRSGIYDYVGFVFRDDGIIGIDIDCGFEGDGTLSAVAWDIMMRCRSYTEKSRSGRGIHVLLRGTLPFPGRNNGAGVEIYRTNRYFILTGKKLVFAELREDQGAIDEILSRYFPDAPRGGEDNPGTRSKFYSPQWQKPEGGRIPLRPRYPRIKPGTRNDSLTSLAGQLWGQGYAEDEIYRELLRVNAEACVPPLPLREIESIILSIRKYRR